MIAHNRPQGPCAVEVGGGLAADGCHNDRKKGGRHCHRGPSSSSGSVRPLGIVSGGRSRGAFANCTAARAAGAAPVRRGDDRYGRHLTVIMMALGVNSWENALFSVPRRLRRGQRRAGYWWGLIAGLSISCPHALLFRLHHAALRGRPLQIEQPRDWAGLLPKSD